MIKIETKNGTYYYQNWQYNLAWILVGLIGFIIGICI